MKKRIIATLLLMYMLLASICLPVSAANNKLPEGFVTLDKIFELENGHGLQPMDYSKVSGLYLVLDHVTSTATTLGVKGRHATYGLDVKPTGESVTVSSSLSDKPYLTIIRDETADGFSINGSYNWESNTEALGTQVCKSDFSLSMSNINFGTYLPYADFTGTFNAAGGRTYNDKTYSHDLNETHVEGGLKKQEDGSIFLLFTVKNIVLHFEILGAVPKGQKVSGITQKASKDSGEDKGASVDSDIVDIGTDLGGAVAVGVLSTGAAIGAAAAASGKGKSKGDQKKKSYKMYVQKDFGDAIRRGAAKPVKIRARMAEVDENGVSRDRNDLTALISVSGDGMTIHSAALVGRYCEATVSVPENNYNDTANIIFTFNGEGGTFTNTVIFRLVDGPSIKFVEETEKPGEHILNSSRCYIDAIYGDKFTYTAKFMVVDATVMPEVKDITADKINGFDVRFEETDRQYVYKVIIKNNTATLPEKEQSVFAKPTEMTFDFHVKVQGEDKPLEGHVSMCMHNEGITVSSKEIKREALWIDTLPVENSGVSFSDIRPVLFDVLVCYIGKDGAVILKNPEVSFGDINDKGLYGNTFKENFRFKTARLSDGTHGFFPIDTLPQACEPYETLLPIVYKGEKKLEAEIPLRLGGEEPTPPSQEEWEKAYEKLKKDIKLFGVDTNDSTTKYLLAHAHEHSAEELAFTRKWIIIAGMHFYAEQSRQYQKIDQTMTRYIIVANSFVKAGDYAVEVLLTMYWGKTAGKITTNFVNPLKNMLANYIGQYIGPGSESGTGNYEKMPFFKTILSGTQDALSEAMTGDLKPDPEKLGYIVSAYLMVSFVKHYYEGEGNVKGDIYRSMIAAGGDLTLAKFKAWLSNKISEYSEEMWKKIGQLFGSVIRTYFNSALKEAAENAGKKAFESSIRSAVQSGGVDSLKYATAKLAKEGAKVIQEESSKILLKQYSESLGKEMASGMNTALAFVLNYCFGGTKDENEMLGLSVEDVLKELFFDRFGVYINKVYTAVKNPLDLGIKVSNGILSIEILGYVVEISLEKNALVVIGLVFDFCFGWMEDLWNIATSNPSSLPDPRDTVTYASAKLEEGKEILENMPPITYHKKDKQ